MFKNFFLLLLLLLGTTCYASQVETNFQVQVPRYLKITPITSPILVAHVQDSSGNLFTPLSTKFRVVTNELNTTLYLTARVSTESGEENAFFAQGNQVYLAFSSMENIPTSQALSGCKCGNESKGVIAYPVLSILGAQSRFIPSKEKFEVLLQENGTYNIDVIIGANVLRGSFDNKDGKGFYKAIISLTETDI